MFHHSRAILWFSFSIASPAIAQITAPPLPSSRPASPDQPDRDDEEQKAATNPAQVQKGAGSPTIDDDEDTRPQATGTSQSKPGADEDEEEGGTQPNNPIVVTARRLDVARSQIDVALGSTVYSLTNDTIENRPGGETGSISQILTQAPGVILSGTTLTVRGSPANQVRINNVIVPEAISDPADHLSSRLAETTRLITGTLPAQFGLRRRA